MMAAPLFRSIHRASDGIHEARMYDVLCQCIWEFSRHFRLDEKVRHWR